jgi:acyl transferase domain-containing protein/acyl carrier protein
VGAACRLPGGVEDLDQYWDLLASGVDAVSEIPANRWSVAEWYDPDPDKPGKMATRWGGFLNSVDRFDPQFFGISPREAEGMDPQQRLLLEVSWEALENAAQHPGRLAETRTGVFIGVASDEYGRLLARDGALGGIDSYYASGIARSVAAGRISYVLGLQGPNLSVDTACSSSLVAVHQACQSLRSGECRMALAGGVNVILAPEATVALSRSKMLSPEGRCKAFDDSADGFVRAEGCVVLVLKRLSDATADGDRILAIVRGSATNQDGRTSGLTVPSGPAQEAVIRQALADAGVRPDEVDFVEAHGTGTSLGDPIEAHALVAALGRQRPADKPLYVGSVKANLGHLEAAAGATGLLKAALALSRETIPPQLYFRRWNRNIDLKGAPLTVAVAPVRWSRGATPRRAGVSSFGFSGANVHVILEEPPLPAPPTPASGPQLLRLSARSQTALAALARKYCAFFDRHPECSPADVCYTAARFRMQYPWYLEVTGETLDQLRRNLQVALERGEFRFAEQELAPAPIRQEGHKLPAPSTPFDRQRYWKPDSMTPKGEHPLLGRRLSSPALSSAVYETSTGRWPAFLQDHRVQGRPILPMAAFVEILLAATGGAAIEEILVPEALPLTGLTVQAVAGSERVEVFASAGGEDWKTHASARPAAPGSRPAGVSIASVLARMPRRVDPVEHYARLRRHGADLGPAFQLVESLSAGDGEALGSLRLPEDAAAYRIHPVLLDACFQVLNAAVEEVDSLYLPVGVASFTLFERPQGALWGFAAVRERQGDSLLADIRLLDAEGATLAAVEGLRLRRAAVRRPECTLHEIAWRSQADEAVASAALEGSWLILPDQGGAGLALADAMTSAGAVCRMVTPETPVEELLAADDLRGLVYLRALDGGLPELAADERRLCAPLLEVAAGLATARSGAPPQIVIVTRGAQAVARGDAPSPEQSLLWGVARSLRLEYPDLRCLTVDLDPNAPPEAETIAREIRSTGAESQVAWRGAERFVARLSASAGNCVRVEKSQPGTLDGLKRVLGFRRRPARGEVEIHVDATGLNFRDVLNALDLYPGDAGPLGAECAGRIAAVGEGVEGFAVGDAVVAIARGSLATHATAEATLVAHRPENLSFEEAATIPVAYLTARYALDYTARLRAGERVLIHSAAGGVGLAAVAEALRAGAVVFATAGSEEKRAYLRSLGVHHVMSSRSLDFGREVMEATSGEGVDVLLNSLSGDFITENFRILARGGRYLEIGKRGIWEPARVQAQRPDAQYFILDWGEQYLADPEPVAAIFRAVVADARAGLVRPLPSRRFDLAGAVAAFREMSQARHIGKIVLTPSPLRGEARYLITGGLRGLGLRVAEWMVERGARQLVLLGRNAPAPDAERSIAEMTRRGARIEVVRADVSRRQDLEPLFARMAAGGAPLKGIVHAAGVLEDGVLAQMSWERFRHVLAPKVEGVRLLEELSGGMELDFFVLFSSLASVLGSPGQANHSAANCFLDAAAFRRRAEGRPAVSINWGPWSTIGAAAGDKASKHLAGHGIGSMTPAQGLDVLELAMAAEEAQIAAAVADWPEIQQTLHLEAPYLSEVVAPEASTVRQAPASAELASSLAHADGAHRREVLVDEVRRRACTVLGLDPAHPLDAARPLSDYGLDSLMALELRNALASAAGKPLPSTLIFSYPSIGALADFLGEQISEEAAEAAPEPEPDDDFLARIERLSSSEVERLLHEASEGSL